MLVHLAPPRRPAASTSCCSTRSTCSPRRCGGRGAAPSGSTSTCASSSPLPRRAARQPAGRPTSRRAATCARSSRCSARWTGKAAWVTGVRRVDGPTRANAPVVRFDIGRNIVKINPLAALDRRRHGALRRSSTTCPPNPLTDRGYPSHRLLAVHPAGRARRGQARRPLGRQRQDRMRAARMSRRPSARASPHARVRAPRRADRRGDHHHPRGRHRVREPGAAVQRRQGLRGAAAPRGAGVRARRGCRSR